MTRTLPAIALAALLLCSAAACGGGSSAAGSPESTPDPAGTGGGGTQGELGSVLALGEEFLLADLLSLGVRPVASTATVSDVGFSGLDEFDTEGIEVLPNSEANLEQLAALDVDTVIVQQYVIDQVGREKLEALGEVIVAPTGTGAEELTELGELVGRTDDAADLVADLEAAQDAAADAAAEGCEVSVGTIYPGPSPAAWVAAPNNVAIALEDLGCELAPSADDQSPDGAGRVHLSLENLGMLSAPTLIMLQSSDVEGEDAALAEIEDDPLWQQLPAVEGDDVTILDRLGYPGVAGLIRLHDELAEIVG